MEQTTMDFELAERAAVMAMRESGCEADRPDVAAVLRGLGARVIEVDRRHMPFTRADYGIHDGRPLVRIRKGTPLQQATFAAAHECGHLAHRMFGLAPRCHESFANLFAGAILMPRDSLRAAWARLGLVYEVASEWPDVPPTAVALRLGVGEVGLVDLCVTQGSGVRYSRSRRTIGPDVVAAGRATRRSRTVSRPGLRACRLADGNNRAAVVLA